MLFILFPSVKGLKFYMQISELIEDSQNYLGMQNMHILKLQIWCQK